MKINPLKTIGFKLYTFTFVLITSAILVVSWQFSDFFMLYLQHNFRKNTTDAAQIAGLQMVAGIRDLERTVTTGLQADKAVSKENFARIDKNLSELNSNLRSYQVTLLKPAGETKIMFSRPLTPVAFLDEIPEVKQDLLANLENQNIFLFPIKDEIGIVFSYRVTKGGGYLVHFLKMDQKFLDGHTAIQENRLIRVVNHSLQDLLPAELRGSAFESWTEGPAPWKSALSNQVGSGFLGDINDQSGKEWVGSFYKDGIYGFTILVLHLASDVEGSLMSVVEQTLEWAVLIILVSIMLAYLLTRSIVRNLGALFQATLQIAQGNLAYRVAIKSKDEIGYLGAAINWMSGQIGHLLQNEKKRIVYEQELLTANMVQNTFFQGDQLESLPFLVTSYYKPASQCGGDWWRHYRIADGIDLVVMGDATGHGVPAALVTAIAFSTTDFCVERIRRGEADFREPSYILQELNRILYGCLEGQFCMTFVALVMDSYAGKVYYSNGGHTFPLLLPKDPNDSRIKNRRRNIVPYLNLDYNSKRDSSILGISPATNFSNETKDLKPGDRLLIYTDGITETKGQTGRLWGTRGLLKTLDQTTDLDLVQVKERIISSLKNYNVATDEFEDDITLLLVEYQQREAVQKHAS